MNEQFETTRLPRGEIQIMSALSLEFLKPGRAEMKFPVDFLHLLEIARDAKLIELTEHQQNALAAVGNQGSRFFTVKPTEKLLPLQDKTKTTDKWICVTVGKCEVTEILKESEYNPKTVAQGEEYHLVLGKYMDIPNENARALGNEALATTEKKEMKIRVLLKFNPFNKTYSFLAADAGYIDKDDWISNNVP